MALMSSAILELLVRSSQALAKGKQTSALNPMIWFIVIVSPLCFGLTTLTTDLIFRCVLIFLGCIPIVSFVIAYFYFMFKNPDYLRSEQFQLQNHTGLFPAMLIDMKTFTKVRLVDWPPIHEVCLDLNAVECYFFRNDKGYEGNLVLRIFGDNYHIDSESTKKVCEILKINNSWSP